MNSIVCSSLHKLHKSSILASRPVCHKSSFEPKKIVDRSKTSILLMMQAVKYDINIDYLKNSNQLGLPSCIKILKLLNQYKDIADICNLMVENQFNNFDSDSSYFNFVKLWSKLFTIDDVELQSLQLHVNDNLRNFLKVVLHLQAKIHKTIIRSMLAFLSNYIQNVQDISDCIKYEAICFLTDRSYVSEFIVKDFQRLIVQKQKISQIMERQDMNQITNCFETVLYKLKTLVNLNKLKIQTNKQNYEDLLQVFFTMLEHTSTFEYIVGMKIAPMIFIDDIFIANKQKYLQIIHKIISPTTYTTLRLNRQLLTITFDKLLLFSGSTPSEKHEIHHILSSYQRCLLLNRYIMDDSFRGNTSLILLCKKFEYFSPFLFYDIYVNYLGKRANLNNQKVVKRDRIPLKIIKILRLYEVQVMMKMVEGMGLSFQRDMVDLLDASVRYSFGYNSNIFQNFASQELNFTDNQSTYLGISQKSPSSQSIIRAMEQAAISYCEKMERKLGINFKNIIPLNNFASPINIAANFGARLKIFLQTILYSRELRTEKNLIIEVQEIFKNPAFIKKLEENKYYPGLAEVVFLMYQEGLAQGLKLKQAPITTFIQINEPQFNRKMGKTIVALQTLEQDLENIRYGNNIQCLTFQLKIDNSLLYKKSANFFLSDSRYNHIKTYEELNLSVQKFLKELKEKDDNLKNLLFFANNPQFPFIADLLIFYRKKIISIIFTSPEQKPILEQYFRQILEQRQKVESNTSSIGNEKAELKATTKEELKTTKEEEVKSKKQASIYNKHLIRHLMKKGHIIFLSNKEDVRRFCINLQINRIQF